jgi:hypothetical protein
VSNRGPSPEEQHRSKLPIPLKDIVALVEYIGPTEERRHMKEMLWPTARALRTLVTST